jgi:hypothetical protein
MYRALWTPDGIKTMMHTERLDLPILLVHGTRDFAIGPRVQRSGWQRYAPHLTPSTAPATGCSTNARS